MKKDLRTFLDQKVLEYNQPAFIEKDPICIPHDYKKKQDIEIAGFFAAIFAWGNRTTIINKSKDLMLLMDNAPHDFILWHKPAQLKQLFRFRHRTFNTSDLLYFIEFLRHHYSANESLETAFSKWMEKTDTDTARALTGFHHYFFSMEHLTRTKKHIATPYAGSSCKRLNMYLRWMVRKDASGVDFGLWNRISPAQLVCPIDLHVARVAQRFGLLTRKKADWAAAIELTEYLRQFDPNDPVKYDFALFGLGVMEKYV